MQTPCWMSESLCYFQPTRPPWEFRSDPGGDLFGQGCPIYLPNFCLPMTSRSKVINYGHISAPFGLTRKKHEGFGRTYLPTIRELPASLPSKSTVISRETCDLSTYQCTSLICITIHTRQADERRHGRVYGRTDMRPSDDRNTRPSAITKQGSNNQKP